MSPIIVVCLALAAALFVLFRRFLRPRPGWNAFRRGVEEHTRTEHRNLLRANEAISDAEALRPVLSALADLPLPPGVTLRIRADTPGPGQARVEVTSPTDFYIMRLAHSHYRRAHSPNSAHAGQWLVTMEDTGKTTDGPQPKENAAPPSKEEAFDDLADYMARLQTFIAHLSGRN